MARSLPVARSVEPPRAARRAPRGGSSGARALSMAAFDHAIVRFKRMLRGAKERLELACLGVLDVETAYI